MAHIALAVSDRARSHRFYACSKVMGHWATTDHFTVFIPFTLVTWAFGAFAGRRLRQPSTP